MARHCFKRLLGKKDEKRLNDRDHEGEERRANEGEFDSRGSFVIANKGGAAIAAPLLRCDVRRGHGAFPTA
ncbi:hypothetical protein S23_07180 [Bradyrhizobium cosmicum]|uniref:Uncharacterized protein n=1 Tax=Bradyrhizobium cosmicum TaxID=1404864 RepID=A0AAI8M9N2_9BRAD|nr:hypothetical protein S23_07180 [Bradyrhizobium cosmicum]